MSNNTNTLIAGLLIGGGILWMVTKGRANQHYQGLDPRYQNHPPPPTSSRDSSKWESWVATVLAIYGAAKELWEPGGPFYKYKDDPIFDEINPNDTSTTV